MNIIIKKINTIIAKLEKKIAKISNSLLPERSIKIDKSTKVDKSIKTNIKKNKDIASDSIISTRVIKAPKASIDKINLITKYAIYDSVEHISEIVKIVSISSHSIISMKSIAYYSLFISELERSKDLLNFYHLNNFIINYLLIIKKLKNL